MLTNKVENKPIVQIDIEKWIPGSDQIVSLDLKQFLFREMILKEADFRDQIEIFDWSIYSEKFVLIEVSNGAIVPQWAFLIIAQKLDLVQATAFSKSDNIREKILLHIIEQRDLSEYAGKRVLIKGCGKESLSHEPYVRLTQRMSPLVKALSFGEVCSTVPIFKN
jgi:hypothetical protein